MGKLGSCNRSVEQDLVIWIFQSSTNQGWKLMNDIEKELTGYDYRRRIRWSGTNWIRDELVEDDLGME